MRPIVTLWMIAVSPDACHFHFSEKREETNVDAARGIGWGHCVHFRESGLQTVEGGVRKQISHQDEGDIESGRIIINSLEQLRKVWPEIFRKNES